MTSQLFGRILVAVDDMLFSSKIRTTAKQAGVEIQFARTPADILTQARALNPALVIFDLNSARIDSIALDPTPLTAPRPKRMFFPTLVNEKFDSLTSGGRTPIPICAAS